MTIAEASPESRTDEDDGKVVAVSEYEVIVGAAIKRDLETMRFNHRSRVKPSPKHPEILFTD